MPKTSTPPKRAIVELNDNTVANRWYSWDSSKLLAVFIENRKNKRCNAKITLTLFGPRKPYLYLSCITLMVFCFSYCSCVDPMLLIWILIYDETDATWYSQFIHTTDQPWAFLISSVLLSLLFSSLSLFCLSAFVCDGNRDSHVRRRSYHAIFSRFSPFATWSNLTPSGIINSFSSFQVSHQKLFQTQLMFHLREIL